MPAAIVVENVSKKFLIGTAQYSSLRDVIARPVRRLLGRPGEMETARTREFWALKDVSFEVEKGATLGIIGPNGAGKSTLLKLISRVSKPTSGKITTHGRVSALIEVGAGFHDELTGRENVYLNGSILGMTKKEIDKKFDAIVDFSGLEQFIDTPVKHYSSGMYARLGFSVAAHVEPEILIVDEVLSVGDWGFQRDCFARMQKIADGGATVVLVSHNMNAVAAFCHSALLLMNGHAVMLRAAKDVINSYSMTAGTKWQEESNDEHAVRIDSVDLLDGNSSATRIFESGAPFTLLVTFSAQRELTRPVVHLELRDLRNLELFRTDTARAGLDLGVLAPGDVFTLRVTGVVNLLAGRFRWRAVVKSLIGDVLTDTPLLVEFDAVGRTISDGLVDIRPAVSIGKAERLGSKTEH